jgi:predicted  nucleic acid-binding Zn-ribbon protein
MITTGGSPMAADTLDVRMARLEGAYEQINKRLETLHVDVQDIRGTIERLGAKIDSTYQRLDTKIELLDAKLDTTFRWVIGIVLVNWITLMLAIFLRS